MEPVAFALGIVVCLVAQSVLSHFESAASMRKRSFEIGARSYAKEAAKATYELAMSRARALEEKWAVKTTQE